MAGFRKFLRFIFPKKSPEVLFKSDYQEELKALADKHGWFKEGR